MDAGVQPGPEAPADKQTQIPAEKAAAEIRAIQGIEDNTQFLGAVLTLAVSFTGARAGFLYLVLPGGGPVQCLANRSPGGLDGKLVYSPGIRKAVGQAMESNRLVKESLDQPSFEDFQFLCAPTRNGNQLLALGLVMGPEREEHLDECELLLVMVSQLIEWRGQSSKSSELNAAYDRTRRLLELFYDAGKQTDYERAFAVLVDELQRFIGCQQVAIGFGNEDRVRLASLSGASKHDRRGHTVELINRAMREAIGVNSAIVWPAEAGFPDEVLVSGDQGELIKALEVDALVAIPLPGSGSKPAGAWICTWKGRVSGFRREWDLISALTPELAVVAELMRRSKPRGLRAKWSRAWSKAKAPKKVALALAVALFTGAMFFPVDFRVSAECRLRPEETRLVAAPFDGIMMSPMVKPGQLVEENQLLATLDGREMEWKLAELETKKAAKEKTFGEALGRDDVLAAQLEKLDAETLGIDIELLKWNTANLEVRAPIRGLILSGDLEKSEGVPVAKGQKLFEVAPIDMLRLEIAVPDSDSALIEEGMEVSVRLESRADEILKSEIVEIYPVSEVLDEKNVFVCFAMLGNEEGSLRPGMRGRARIHVGRAALGWILFRKPIEFVRLNFWW